MYMPSMTVMNLSERGLKGSSSAVFRWTSFWAGGLGGEVEVTNVVEVMTSGDARISFNEDTDTLELSFARCLELLVSLMTILVAGLTFVFIQMPCRGRK